MAAVLCGLVARHGTRLIRRQFRRLDDALDGLATTLAGADRK